MASLALNQMVLYKHGVGFFVRGGATSGETLDLTFRQDEVNDVLKSLTIFDRAGGKVLGIDYQTPMDKAARLASSSIKLSEQATQRDLLRDLRGRLVTISVAGVQEPVSGRVVGVDIPPARKNAEGEAERTAVVGIAGDDGQVRFFPLDGLRGVTIHDRQSAQDLSFFLDTNMQEDNRRNVHVRLSEGDHDLVVQYVAPSPTWRVSYRVVAESGKDTPGGRALVQGWGLFDNRLEEDLENVSVTLVAGQPISFIYDLYESRIPERPVVRDESRVAPGPIRVDGAMPLAAGAAPRPRRERSEDILQSKVAFGAGMAAEDQASGLRYATMATSLNELSDTFATTSEGVESGEFFQYRVSTPVSVRRGESAMVPILSAEIGYERELVYNGSKLPKHPVAALRFVNTTGLTLEGGPVTVSEDGDYRGEAVVPFTKDGGEVYLPYAVELGVTITERPTTSRIDTGVGFKDYLLVYEVYYITSVEYVIENTTPHELVVSIEAGIQTGYELVDTPVPDSETARDQRWRVTAPPQARTSFTRRERIRKYRSDVLRGLRFEELQQFLENKWLDRKTFETLSSLVDTLRSIERLRAEEAELDTQRARLNDQQAQVRENLNALQGSGDEANLRGRMINRLEKAQDQLDALEIQQGTIQLQISEAEAQVDQIIAGLPQMEGDPNQ